MCAKRAEEGEHEEQLCRREEANETRNQRLDAVFKQLRIVLHRADIRDDLHPEQRETVSPYIKEEESSETSHIKEEEQEVDINFPLFGVIVKREDGNGDHCGGSAELDGLMAPLSDSDDIMSQFADTDAHSKAVVQG
ncbi:uncharacterized protein LOC133473243 isoform X2 [Phyllopteryx taeniolatus]|uniref:uncharacterized protein LOC133473243 isoform X2 n=1 Tax=Phyllopteryx taeniolatus TaxID=161469 RepID=UPI002AD54937|nr:uncharacterized protein LOC133473243 isoform X2 [Phyllopteryx taeniolatus]